jgi:hypothetical protein
MINSAVSSRESGPSTSAARFAGRGESREWSQQESSGASRHTQRGLAVVVRGAAESAPGGLVRQIGVAGDSSRRLLGKQQLLGAQQRGLRPIRPQLEDAFRNMLKCSDYCVSPWELDASAAGEWFPQQLLRRGTDQLMQINMAIRSRKSGPVPVISNTASRPGGGGTPQGIIRGDYPSPADCPPALTARSRRNMRLPTHHDRITPATRSMRKARVRTVPVPRATPPTVSVK